MTTRRARLICILLAACALIVTGSQWYPISVALLTVDVPFEPGYGPNLKGMARRTRWGDPPIRHGWTRIWYADTGRLALETEYSFNRILRSTTWYESGSVASQMPEQPTVKPVYFSANHEGPWEWGVGDQQEPSMPEWMYDYRKWNAALSALGKRYRSISN